MKQTRNAAYGMASLVLTGLVLSCADEADKGDTAAAPPLLGVFELPISLRTTDPAPSEAHDVQVSPTKVQVNGQLIGELSGGKLAGDTRSKFTQALSSPARRQVALQVHSQVPYATAVELLALLREAGAETVSVKVRKPSGTETGFLALGSYRVGPKSAPEDDLEVAGAQARSWSEFTGVWEQVYEACGGSDSGNCAYKPEKVAEGGQLKLELYAAGQGVNVNFYRTGAPPPAEPKSDPKADPKAAQGRAGKGAAKSEHTDPAAEIENAPPATQALFQFRAKEAVKVPSAVSGITAPLCGKSVCGVAVRAEAATMSARIVSLLGAAFPDGTVAPAVRFERP
ncbi:MAG: hypothetical protein OXR73_27185 [Myxococcales bacterium]|nr:hypothetical protein [Myxococcales bacterium]